ncbi:bacteriophage spanin2 family protein [Roseibacterium sp. SDUM158017]|uniref:bacteriophage spanin2 family protein n=1 Tax=Roseicyclus salinarum TaxID=3036773 RepID=UPI0024157AFA|nr:bacteriophage spanin2 family protein [Roseibacterium sp. SDUM158017]MDG4650134.1 bacteriophage spanin2 family protein [Roseibacterium sp. SDUM158017]
MRAVAAFLSLVALAACGGPLSLLTGGGPNVAANVQAGAENRQAAVSIERQAPTLSLRPNARTGNVEQSTGETGVRTERVETIIVRNDVPPWVWLLAILGWLLPSPGEIGRSIAGLWGRRDAV